MSSISKLIFVLFPILFACDPMRNSSERIAVECGLDQKSVQQLRYIKILPALGQSFESKDTLALKTSYQNAHGETQTLPLTPRACVILPNEEGIIQIIDSRNGESLTKSIKKESTQQSLITLNLAPKPEIQASLSCPDEGLFASEILAQPMSLSISGEIAGLDIRLDLFNQDNVFVKTILRKPKGQTELSLPSSIDIRDVTEGSYLLKIYGNHASDGIDSRPRLLSPEKICRLNILRGAVYVGGFKPETKQLVYPPHSNLPWTIQNPFEKLFVCQEKRTFADQSPGNPSADCKPRSICKDPAQYKESIQVSTETPGVFDYFVFAENRAGNRSDLKCQTIIVSDAPPALSVNWAHDDIKHPGSILRKPYAILKANIETQHGLIDSESIKNNLTCKVDFEIKGKNTFSEKGVTCTEGRCAGQSLADFVPCDTEIAFTMVDALNQPMLLNSRLRLTVRATDGAGHTSEAQASVWINQSTWIKDTLSFIYDSRPLYITDFLIDRSSDIVGVFSEGAVAQLAAFKNGSWTRFESDGQPAEEYNLAPTRDGSIRIARQKRMVNGFKVDVFSYNDSQFVPVAITPDDNLVPKCHSFMVGPAEATYCMGSDINQLFQLNASRWIKIPAPVEISAISAESLTDWRILQDGRVAAITRYDIFLWNGTSWHKVISHGLGETLFFLDLIEDFKGRLWIYAQPVEKTHGLYRIDASGLVRYPSPVPLTTTTGFAAHPRSAQGLTHFAVDFLQFDFNTDSWVDTMYPAWRYSELDDRKAWIGESNQTLTQLGDKGVFEGINNTLYWPIKALGFTPSVKQFQRDNNLLYFVDMSTVPWQLTRIKTSLISSFDSNMTGLPASLATGSWDNAEGQTVLNFSDGNQFILHKDRIEKVKSPDAFKETMQVTALSSGRYCISKLSGLWLYDATQNTNFNFAPDKGTGGNVQQCAEDSHGKLWWLHYTNRTVHTFDGQNSRTMEVLNSDGEEPRTLKSVLHGSRILLATSRRLLILKPDGSAERAIELGEIESTEQLTSIQSLVLITETKVLMQANTLTPKKAFFQIDLESNTIKEDIELEKVVGPYFISRSEVRQGRIYLLTLSPTALLVTGYNGKWKISGSRADFEHVPSQKNGYPWWFAVDTYERIWFITNRTPSKLGRAEPEFIP